MRLYFLILVLFQSMVTIWCQCQLTLDQVEQETRLVARARNGTLELLNIDKIPRGDVIYFICSETNVVQVVCGENGAFSHILPIQNCASPPRAVVKEITDSNCRFTSYRVGYQIGHQYIELYRSCFRRSDLSTAVTVFNGYPYSLVTSRPEISFTTDGVLTLKEASSYQASKIYDRFEQLLGPNQTYSLSKSHLIIDRGHLVPSGDFLFDMNMRATFKYANAIPQFSSINRGNWKSIEEFVRARIATIGWARIMTGAFHVLSLPDINGNLVEMYLLDGNRNPIPKWIYKVVNSPYETIVFLTYNNIFNMALPQAVCKTVPCPIQLKNELKSGLTVCCDPQDFAQNVFPYVK